MLEQLKADVCSANVELGNSELCAMTWGNVSGIDRESGCVVIKPSGIRYGDLTPDACVVVDLDGTVVEGSGKPSVDTQTHAALYRAFPKIGGVTHTHSALATAFAQAGMPIPCLGTTHADHFYGEVPLTRFLTQDEVEADYEISTGTVIVERFDRLDSAVVPGVLVAGHGPFTWGADAAESLENGIALEHIAEMAMCTLRLNPNAEPLPDYVLAKHFFRKHGKDAYYGQG